MTTGRIDRSTDPKPRQIAQQRRTKNEERNGRTDGRDGVALRRSVTAFRKRTIVRRTGVRPGIEQAFDVHAFDSLAEQVFDEQVFDGKSNICSGSQKGYRAFRLWTPPHPPHRSFFHPPWEGAWDV